MLLLVDGFLSLEECDAVRTLGAPHLKRSKVSAGGRALNLGLVASTGLIRLHLMHADFELGA